MKRGGNLVEKDGMGKSVEKPSQKRSKFYRNYVTIFYVLYVVTLAATLGCTFLPEIDDTSTFLQFSSTICTTGTALLSSLDNCNK